MIVRRKLLTNILLASLLLGVVGGCLMQAENVLAMDNIGVMAAMEKNNGCKTAEVTANGCASPSHETHHVVTPAVLKNGIIGILFALFAVAFFIIIKRTDTQTTETKFRLILKKRFDHALYWHKIPTLLACFRKGILNPKLHNA